MIKFFRRIRQQLLSENKFTKYLFYAVGEIVLVVIGILIALQINNWNENRKLLQKEERILRSLQTDLETDIREINYQIQFKKRMIGEYQKCLDILSEKEPGSKAELMQNLQTILQVGGVVLNKTTFNNLETTGELRLIRSKPLADSISQYYNTGYEGWESALKDYTRQITAPYLLSFDYLPQLSFKDSDGAIRTTPGKPSDFKKPERALEDYKQDYFMINILRQKTYNLQALLDKYIGLKEYAINLDRSIQKHLDQE